MASKSEQYRKNEKKLESSHALILTLGSLLVLGGIISGELNVYAVAALDLIIVVVTQYLLRNKDSVIPKIDITFVLLVIHHLTLLAPALLPDIAGDDDSKVAAFASYTFALYNIVRSIE